MQQLFAWANHNRAIVGVLLGATVIMFGFYRGSMRLMHFFFHVSDKQIFEIGFVTGIVSAVVIAGAGLYMQRYLTFHVEHVYRAALQELRKHKAVEANLGEFLKRTDYFDAIFTEPEEGPMITP